SGSRQGTVTVTEFTGGGAKGGPEQEKALADIEKLGGSVIRNWGPEEDGVFVDLQGQEKVTDGDLAVLERVPDLPALVLTGVPLTDAGLAHLQGSTRLQQLYLGSDGITDAGLAHLQGLTGLRKLKLETNQVTDAGLTHLKGLTQLRELTLHSREVTDVGL